MKQFATRDNLFITLVGIFMAVILISTIASSKMVAIGPFIFDAGTILFPISYVLAAFLTELYGLKRAQVAIITGFFAQILASGTFFIVGILPAYTEWGGQEAFMSILGIVPRIAAASVIAYLIGEFINIHFLSFLKKHIAIRNIRMIVALIVAQLIDTVLFSTIAFAGTMPLSDLAVLVGTVLLIKLVAILVLTPISSYVVKRLEKDIARPAN